MNQGLNIYIISEDHIFIRLIEVMLSNEIPGISTVRINSFAEVRTMNTDKRPDAVIIDDFIRGASVIELITFLRFDRQLSCPAFLFCEYSPELINEAMKKGFNNYFTKPFDPAVVSSEIRKSLAGAN